MLSISTIPSVIPNAHATGTIYVDPGNQSLAVTGTIVKYRVNVTNVGPFNAWDIMVWVNGTSSLDPLNVSITGNLFANYGQVLELVNCVDGGRGVNGQPGNMGCTIDDGPGIVHSAAVFPGAPPGPGSGPLFTINYNATGGPGTALHIFNDILANATPNPVPHTASDGVYGNPQPSFFTTYKPNSLTLLAGKNGVSTITFTSLASFTGNVNLTGAVSPPGPTISFSKPTVKLTAGGTNSSVLTVYTTTSTAAGRYLVTVNATSGSLFHSIVVIVFISQARADMVVTSLSVSPTGNITIGQTVSMTATVLNNGTLTGDFTLQIIWNNLLVAQRNGTLAPNKDQSISLAWDTSGSLPGSSSIRARVSTLATPATNEYQGPMVTLVATAQPSLVDPLLAGGSIAAVSLAALFLLLRRKKGARAGGLPHRR